jgi:uroporphyrinogen-III synthase
MRVLITRPEREATALATALSERGHQAVIAPLFQLELLPPSDFAPALAACQAVLLTSANGARALAEANEMRAKPVFAVGDVTARTAEGLGFATVVSAGGNVTALAALVAERLKPEDGPLLHISGVAVAGDLAGTLGARGFDVRRFALYDAREVAALPDSARAALEAHALDVAAFFSPRAGTLFAKLVFEAGLAQTCSGIAAVAISPAAAEPLRALPFKATLAAPQPTRQAVLDMIDRLPEAGYQETKPPEPAPESVMSDTSSPSSAPPPSAPEPIAAPRGGLGFMGAFVTGLIAAVIVVAGAVLSLPYWPEQVRAMWQGGTAANVENTKRALQGDLARMEQEIERRQLDVWTRDKAEELNRRSAESNAQEAKRRAEAAALQAASEAARHELDARLDDLDKRVRAAATTAAQADRPAATDPAINELRAKVTALENRSPDADIVKEVVALKGEIAKLQKTIDDAAAKAQSDAKAATGREANALSAARASAVIGIAARLSAALDSGQPFAGDLGLLTPFAQDDAKLGEATAQLKPLADKGVAARATLAADFPALAKAALAEDLADDSFWQRFLGKLRGLMSIRKVGDVPGDSAEAKLARAEAALNVGDLAKAVELVKSLPPQTQRATAAWLARADAHLSAERAVDQLAARAVALLGAAGQAQ